MVSARQPAPGVLNGVMQNVLACDSCTRHHCESSVGIVWFYGHSNETHSLCCGLSGRHSWRVHRHLPRLSNCTGAAGGIGSGAAEITRTPDLAAWLLRLDRRRLPVARRTVGRASGTRHLVAGWLLAVAERFVHLGAGTLVVNGRATQFCQLRSAWCRQRLIRLRVTRKPRMPTEIQHFIGVRLCANLKPITTRWPAGIRAGADFVMPAMR